MNCPECGYAMSDFDIECPRCVNLQKRRRATEQLAPPPPPPAALGTPPPPPPPPQTGSLPPRARRPAAVSATQMPPWLIVVLVLAVLSILGIVGSAGSGHRPRSSQHTDREETTSESAQNQAAPVVRPAVPAIDGSITVDVIDRYCTAGKGAEGYTDAQRRYNWQTMFEGKRVQWVGIVKDVSGSGSCNVSMLCGSTAMTSDTSFAVPAEVGLRLRKGQTITVQGTLSSWTIFGAGLSDVTIW
ncbi:MAG: hypothetical protein ACYC63_13380 [Armatimonadota bacterium]